MILNSAKNSHATFRIFCLPYAGGAGDIFRSWMKFLPASLQVCPIELPGRGRRSEDAPYTNLMRLVQVLGRDLQPYLDMPFAFFGHSMGAVIAFELARFLRQEQLPEVTCLFVSGSRAPQVTHHEKPSYDLPQPDFIEKLRSLGGTTDELLQDRKFRQLVLPLLRADFELIQTYVYTRQLPLACPITAFGGVSDHIATVEDLSRWQEQTTRRFALRMLPGGHFFLNADPRLLVETLAGEVDSLQVFR